VENIIEHTKFIHEYQNAATKKECDEIKNLITSSNIIADCLNIWTCMEYNFNS